MPALLRAPGLSCDRRKRVSTASGPGCSRHLRHSACLPTKSLWVGQPGCEWTVSVHTSSWPRAHLLLLQKPLNIPRRVPDSCEVGGGRAGVSRNALKTKARPPERNSNPSIAPCVSAFPISSRSSALPGQTTAPAGTFWQQKD